MFQLLRNCVQSCVTNLHGPMIAAGLLLLWLIRSVLVKLLISSLHGSVATFASFFCIFLDSMIWTQMSSCRQDKKRVLYQSRVVDHMTPQPIVGSVLWTWQFAIGQELLSYITYLVVFCHFLISLTGFQITGWLNLITQPLLCPIPRKF